MRSATGGWLAALKRRPGWGASKGCSKSARWRARSSAWPRRSRVGVGGVLARAPVCGPERAQQTLGEAAASEAQRPANQAPEQAAARFLTAPHPALSLALGSCGGQRVSPERESIQRLGDAAVEAVGVTQLVGKHRSE